MAGRARLITRGYMLRGHKINRWQWNPTAAVGHADDAPTHARNKPGKKKRKRRKPGGPKWKANKRCLSPDCGNPFKSDAARQPHRRTVHGTAAMAVGDMTRCPECGVMVKNSRIGAHRLRVHSVAL